MHFPDTMSEQQKEQRWHQLLRRVGIKYYLTDNANGIHVTLNSAALVAYGYSASKASEALESAAYQFPIDWKSVEAKLKAEEEWIPNI